MSQIVLVALLTMIIAAILTSGSERLERPARIRPVRTTPPVYKPRHAVTYPKGAHRARK